MTFQGTTDPEPADAVAAINSMMTAAARPERDVQTDMPKKYLLRTGISPNGARLATVRSLFLIVSQFGQSSIVFSGSNCAYLCQ